MLVMIKKTKKNALALDSAYMGIQILGLTTVVDTVSKSAKLDEIPRHKSNGE